MLCNEIIAYTVKHAQRPALSLIIMLCLCLQISAYDFKITPSPNTINQLSNYQLMTNIFGVTGYTIPASSLLMLSFPPEYNTTLLRSRNYTGGLGGSDSCIALCSSVTITFSGNSLIFNGLFPYNIASTDSWSWTYTISNVLNPSVTSVTAFSITIFSGSTICYSSIASSITGPGAFTSQAATLTTQVMYSTVWAVSPLKFTITPSNVIDSIKINFPAKWSLETQSLSAAVIATPTCSSVSNPTITCTYSSPNFVISNLYYYTAGVPIDITISSINNPSAAINAGPISVYLLSGVSTLEQLSNYYIPSSYFSNDILRKASATLAYQPSDKINIQLSFQFAELNANTDMIYITFPPELSIPQTAASYAITMVSVAVTPNITFNAPANTISFNISSASSYQIAVVVTVTGLARPRQCKNITNFVIKTYRSNTYLMDLTSCCSLQLANRQTLLINSIALSNNHHLQASVTYTFTFSTSAVSLVTTDLIQIQFPAEYSSFITAGNSASLCSSVTVSGTNYTGLVKAPTCNIYMNYLLLSSFLISDLAGGETFVVRLPGVTNPAQTPATGFAISTLSASNYVLEQSLNYAITIQPNTLTAFTITPGSLQTNTPNVLYTFVLGNTSPLSSGYSILILFPPDYTFINFNTLQCTINSANYACSRKNSTFGTSTITVLININAAIATISSLTISSVTNPISVAPTGSFVAQIKDSSGTVVESSSGSYTVTMTSSSSFTLFTATAANYSMGTSTLQPAVQFFNSNTNSVWISIAVPFAPIVTPASMLIVFANSNKILYSLASTCKSGQITSACVISSNAGTGNMEVSFTAMTFSNLNSNFMQIEITNLFVIDYQNLQITATFAINGFQSLSLSTPAKISKIYAEPISSYSVSLSTQILGLASTATLTITCSTQTASQLASINVYVPQEFGAASHSLNYASSSFIANQIIINALTNPISPSFTPFLFTILNANGNIIAYSAPTDPSKVYAFTLACSLPCKTCNAPTVCKDCYTTIAWIPQIYFKSSANTCVTQCVEGQYLSNGICSACDATCLTCQMYGSSGFANGNSTYCLSCSASKLLLGSTCVASCPSGYYPSISFCELCMSNCLNCSDSTTCTSCQTSYSLYNNQCLYTCPDSTVSYTNPLTLQASCLACPTNCVSCSSVALPQCLSCFDGFYLYNGGCVSDCLALSLYASYQMSCAACQCITCSNFAFDCSACASPYSLYQSQCILNCPSGYYSSSNVCMTCSSNCLSCTSSSNCQNCLIPYALYVVDATTSTCNLICPVGTIATIDVVSLKYVCEACGGFCQTCQTTVTYCLSCISGYILNNNTCVSACPTGFWLIGGLCRVCSPACQACSNSNPYNCSICSPNYFYYNSSCSSNCSAGTYADISTLICKPCNALCLTCSNSTNCTSCKSGYLYNAFCYSNCTVISSLYYSYNGSCIACQPQCTSCLSTPFACSSCSSASYYFNPVDNSCSFACTAPYYINGTMCSLCQPPCSTCDTLYNSCLTCLGNLSVWNGQCISSCPSGYYSLNNACSQCASACLTCTATTCMTCQTYAYRYLSTCVLDCQTTSLPITIQNYCTNCAEVPYCQTCQSTPNNNYVCFVCIYPYVVFEGNCLNTCPDLYAIENSSNTCVPTPQYSIYLNQLYTDNYPYFPPFCFFGLLALAAAILIYKSYTTYKYTYHFGYLIALSSVFELIFLAYGCRYVINLYLGDYTKQNKLIPLFILAASFAGKLILSTLYLIVVVGCYYLKDVRFRQWKEQHQNGFKCSIMLTFLFGCRFYKLYYSKWMGKNLFSYRIVSVQKFYYEDLFIWLSFIADFADIAAFAIINYNIFITYAVLYLFSFELLLFKAAQWIMLAYDFKKPDRGFFLGDEEEAERMIKQENELKQMEKRKLEMESLVKLIRRKSAENLKIQRLYEHLFIDDFRSVYDPRDYEDVPVVPNKKIQKNINKGKFRKGKRITIQQKLKRFAESIKPAPKVTKDEGFLKGLIYWKPPKQIKVQKKEPQSHQSMMKLLEDKELYYEDISSIQVIDLDQQSGIERDQASSRFRKRKRTGLGIDDQTVVNETYDQIYDPSSIEYLEGEEENDLNGLWNKNYAKKQHLPRTKLQTRYDENDLRVFYHEPLKKRRSKLNQIKSRHY